MSKQASDLAYGALSSIRTAQVYFLSGPILLSASAAFSAATTMLDQAATVLDGNGDGARAKTARWLRDEAAARGREAGVIAFIPFPFDQIGLNGLKKAATRLEADTATFAAGIPLPLPLDPVA